MVIGALALIGAIGLVAWQATRPATPQANGPMASPNAPETIESKARREEVSRMAEADRAVQSRLAAVKATASPTNTSSVSPDYGQLKPISSNASPEALHAAQSAISGKHPEQLSSAFLPSGADAFDAKKWAEDAAWRKNFIETPVPSRCFQCAQPNKDVKPIALASPAYVEALQNQPVELRVKVAPNMPVTFSSFDSAYFTRSKLTTQTVVADENGIATVELVAPPGVMADCRVVAACPVNTGLAKFTVNVHVPELEKPTPAINPLPAAPSSPATVN